MPNAVVARQRFGPDTYEVASTATGGAQVTGGRLVAFSGDEEGKIVLASGDDFIGVALYDAHPDQDPASGSSVSGYPTLDISGLTTEVAVAWTGKFPLEFDGTANPGDTVYATADGKVTATAPESGGRAVGQVLQATAVPADGTGYVRLF